jgi:hypothetical protein
MDHSKAKAIVDRDINALLRAYGLQHWQIRIYYDLQSESDDDGSHYATLGRVSVKPAYEQAAIRLNVGEIDDEAQLLKILRHELSHVVLSPFDLYRTHATRGIKADSKEEREHDHLWDYCVEQAAINLERVWNGAAEHARRGAKAKVRSKGRKRKGS